MKSNHILLHCDNSAVTSGLTKRSFKGAAMGPLRDICMVLAKYDITLEVKWIPTKSNALADMLSRGLYSKIADLYPQLRWLLHGETPQNHGTAKPALTETSPTSYIRASHQRRGRTTPLESEFTPNTVGFMAPAPPSQLV